MKLSKNLKPKDVVRFHQKYTPEPNSGCWLWMAGGDSYGYGRFSACGDTRQAHRVSYVIHRGDIPDGLVIDHLCRVRCCVNPDHMEVVTPQENHLRGVACITHCPHGHEYSDTNTYKNPAGRRFCRACNRKAARRYKQKKRLTA